MGKPLVGYRTDVRTPFGSMGDHFIGMHFFCHLPCEYMVQIPTLLTLGVSNLEDIEKFNEALIRELDKGI